MLKTESELESVDLNAPYFKVGDDFHCHAKQSGSIIGAFQEHANQMKSAEEHFRKMADFLAQHKDRLDEIEVIGDTHNISITAPTDIIDMLVDQELATRYPIEDE